jgi:hypothetical protein
MEIKINSKSKSEKSLYHSILSLKENYQEFKGSSDLSYYSILNSSLNSINSSLNHEKSRQSISCYENNSNQCSQHLINNIHKIPEEIKLLKESHDSEAKPDFNHDFQRVEEELDSNESTAITDEKMISKFDNKSQISDHTSRLGTPCFDSCCCCWTYINDMIDLYQHMNGCAKYYWQRCNCFQYQ